MSTSGSMKKLLCKTLSQYNISSVDEASVKGMIAGEGYTVIRFSAVGSSDETERLLTALYLDERASYEDSFTYNDRERRLVFIRKDVSGDELLYLLAVELGRILTFKTEADGVIGISASEDRLAHEFAHHLIDLAEHGIIYNFFKSFTVESIVFALSSIICLSVVICFFVIKAITGNAALEESTMPEIKSSVIKVVEEQAQENTSQFQIIQTDEGADNSENSSGVADTTLSVVEEVQESKPEAVEETSEQYYSTKSGKKYHSAGCGYISGKTVMPVRKEDIDSGVYTPCSRCIKQ